MSEQWKAVPEDKPWAILNDAGSLIGTFREEHAHLISAAPDMYEALEELMEAFDNLKGGLPDSTFTDPYFKMFNALKKARGESHE